MWNYQFKCFLCINVYLVYLGIYIHIYIYKLTKEGCLCKFIFFFCQNFWEVIKEKIGEGVGYFIMNVIALLIPKIIDFQIYIFFKHQTFFFS